MPPIQLPPDAQGPNTETLAPHPFSLLDTLHIALSSCTSSIPSITSIPGPSACLPCLRSVPSDDSLNQHLNGSSTGAQSARSGINPSRGPARRTGHGTPGWTPNPDGSAIPRARPDELQGLLASHSSSSEDDEDERMSLHSNLGAGRNRNRRKRKRQKKPMTIWGFDLFNVARRAKAAPVPITLGDEDDALYTSLPEHTSPSNLDSSSAASRRPNDLHVLTNAHSSSSTTPSIGTLATSATFDADSDAAPLSASVIDGLSTDPVAAAALLAESIRVDEERRLERVAKEERRRRRHERRAARSSSGKDAKATRDALERERLKLERAKLQGLLPEEDGGEEFEGFQGSGGPQLASLVLRRSRSRTTGSSSSRTTSRTGESGSRASQSRLRVSLRNENSGFENARDRDDRGGGGEEDDFGDFVTVASNGPEEGEQDEVDLDGGLYAGLRRGYAEHRKSVGGSSESGSRYGSKSQHASEVRSGSEGKSGSVGGEREKHKRTLSKSTSSSHGRTYANAPASPSPLGPYPQRSGGSKEGNEMRTQSVDHEAMESKEKKKSNKKSSRSSGSTSQSTSVASPSPVSGTFPPGEAGKYVSPSTVEQGLGFFDAEDFVPSHTPSPNPSYVPSPYAPSPDASYAPSPNASYLPSPNPSLPPPSPFGAGSFVTARTSRRARERAGSVLESGTGSAVGSNSSSARASPRESRSGSVVGVRQGIVGERFGGKDPMRDANGDSVGEGGEGGSERGSAHGIRREGGSGSGSGRKRGESESGFPSTGFGVRRAAGGERKDMVRFLNSGEGL